MSDDSSSPLLSSATFLASPASVASRQHLLTGSHLSEMQGLTLVDDLSVRAPLAPRTASLTRLAQLLPRLEAGGSRLEPLLFGCQHVGPRQLQGISYPAYLVAEVLLY
jgi:hypothetical protein